MIPEAPFDLTVVAPCFNEAKNLHELVLRLQTVFARRKLKGEIVLVNDGSTDETREVLDRLSAENDNLVAVHHPTNRGIEAGWKSGLQAARGRYVCFMDADLQNLPEDVWRLYREINFRRADLVQGCRSSIGRLKDSRYIVSKGLNWILNTLFGLRMRDGKSGFVIALKETMEDILRHRYSYRYFQTFITVTTSAKEYSIQELETLFESRALGRSYMPRFPVKVVFLVLVDIVKAFFEFRLFPKRENLLSEFLKENPPARSDPKLTGWRKWWFELFFLTTSIHKWIITREAKLYYEELKRSQWLPPEKVRELQERKLRRLIRHAYYHVPYYRERLEQAGLEPDDILTLEDLRKLPLLTKQDVRENLYFDVLADNHNKKNMLKITTSGSTGEPLVCYADQHQLEIRWAATQRSMEWTGYRFGDRQVRLWHQTIGMTWSQVIRERIDAWFNRRLFIPAYRMLDKDLGRYVRKIRRYEPVLIDGYAESFNFLARYTKENGMSLGRPKAVISSAQTLPEPSRKAIQEALQCEVFDKYGSREFSGIAYECDVHQGHHVVAESYIVEILKDGRPAAPGEMGEVVITDLNNFCMPFIRYRVGDLAVAVDNSKPCPCGRGLPRIGSIEGRVQAIIVGTNGVYLPGTFFAHLFKDYEHLIRQYQVVQEERGAIQLLVVKAARFDEGTFKEVLDQLRDFLGPDMKINVRYVDHIPLVGTGKHQGSVSKLELDFQKIGHR